MKDTKDSVKLKSNQRSVGIQSITPFREQINPKIAASFPLEELDYPKIALVPHTLTSLVFACSVVLYIAFYTPYDGENSFYGFIGEDAEKVIFPKIFFYLKALLAIIVIFGVSYLPDSIMRRPHPICWRLLFSAALFYMMVVLFLVSLTREDARYMLKVFDLKLNQAPEYKSYADDCSITTSHFPYIDLSNIWKNCDMYVFAHFLGWFVKYLAIRNLWMAMFLSAFFEILEITFKHWLINFTECWWDQLVLDLFGMNLLGIYLGYYACQIFKMKNYEWLVTTKEKGGKSKCNNLYSKSFLKCFFPSDVEIYSWDFLSSTKMFLGVIWFVLIFNLCDLSHFFLKTILWLPITHYVLAYRIFMWGFMCIMGIREYYEYLTNKECKKIGMFLWLCHLMLFIEWVLIYKFSRDMFHEEFPIHVVYFWSIIFISLGITGIRVIYKDLISYFKNNNVIPEESNLSKHRSNISIQQH